MNRSQGLDFYIPGAFLVVILCLRLPALWRDPRNELLRSVCAVLALAVCVDFATAMPSLVAINRFTGVPNAAAPLVYSFLTAFCGASIVLIIRWNSGPEKAAWSARWARRCYLVTGVVIAAINVLFVLGDAPVERLVDMDTYYANTPYIREMLLLYLLAHTANGIIVTCLCWVWARQVHGALRGGLILICIGHQFNLVYDGLKFVAIGSRWLGHDRDYLSAGLAPVVASMSVVLIGGGFVLPLVSQRFTNHLDLWRRLRRLRPLWRELSAATRHTRELAEGPRASIELRVTQLEADIHDGILTVSPYLDACVRQRALARARETVGCPEEAAAVADAAALAHAVVAWAWRVPLPDGADPLRQNHRSVLVSPDDPSGLVRMSRALSTDVVRSFREAAALRHTPDIPVPQRQPSPAGELPPRASVPLEQMDDRLRK
ncbi:MAB_1171c family putative transporter [Streptomyces sp. NPDC006529]|uniref:MAB_1171c family putative transporter n=1 Tax=Streptomyces sp. NPDC006529 TaxID=3157177 RepID=UPI0033B4F62B